ncbi:HPP family protein [Rhizorhabdus dicambivorans]|uniref:HPP family protein n=1 Tax=Rhizorhabdus dicambivorans TaxID=1850238 RepID=A0A2A4FTX4_9SPHN|nr:HPP family protein [Rhizorhabdus dicambivorans]ATE66913.1 HPP family protein [Rhizorhabdus dicambivorans]PCE42217.1 HPP family protein [Rhizorhabdus dicambivorans]
MQKPPPDTPRVHFRWSRYQAMLIAVPVDRAMRDRMISGWGALIGIIATGLLVRGLIGTGAHMPLLIAPIGAAAVLLFAVPASPMAQPWAVIGGNLVSALVGVAVGRLGADPMLSAGLAVGGAIAAMALLRCLHPPGGAVALTAVVGGPAIHDLGFGFVIAPVGLGTVLLLAMAWGFHRFSGHSYPHRAAHVAVPPEPLPGDFSRHDLRRAIEDYPDLLDVGFEDLEEVLLAAEHHAAVRRGQTARK